MHHTSQRNNLEMMLAEIRKIIRRQEGIIARRSIDDRGGSYFGTPRDERDQRHLERQRAIEAYLQADYTALVTGSPLAAAKQSLTPPATEHHGPEY